MTEQTRPTVTATAGGITMTIDLHQMLTAIDPHGSWVGYDPDADEDRYEPSSLETQIATRAAEFLTKQMRTEVKELVQRSVNEQIQTEVSELVRDALENGTLQRTNEWGGKVGEAKPLKQIILDTASDALTKPMGDSYSRNRQTVVQKIVDEAVTAAFRKEVADVVEKARKAALTAVEQSAAEVIRETVQRASRGL